MKPELACAKHCCLNMKIKDETLIIYCLRHVYKTLLSSLDLARSSFYNASSLTGSFVRRCHLLQDHILARVKEGQLLHH